MKMHVEALPLLNDNYAWLLSCPQGPGEPGACAVVDPSEAAPVAAALHQRGLTLRQILVTHHHPDHTGGVAELAAGGAEVIASELDRGRVPAMTRGLRDDEVADVLGCQAHCLAVPGHTLGAIALYLPAAAAVFTGDTLFAAGCGRLFEGTAAQMHASLQRLGALPGATRVCCGHEYTEKNLRFAASIEPNNEAIAARAKQVQALRARGAPSVPDTVDAEHRTNPFLRCGLADVQGAVGAAGAVAALAVLRRRRDDF